jgi:hypothetical protein
MATQRSNSLLRRLENVWSGWLALVLVTALFSGKILRAESVPSVSSSSNSALVSLEYQEAAESVINWGIDMRIQTAPFKKEPAAASGKTIRGVLNFGGPSNAIPFLWQCAAGKLYLDLNRNQDLTDDPSGVFSTSVAGQINYQTFTNIHLLFNTPFGQTRVLADLNFYDFGAQPGGTVAVRSFWQGKLTLQGRDWQAGLIQNGVPSSFENCQLLLRPWEERNRPFNAYDGSFATVPFSYKTFVDGHAYQLERLDRSHNGQAIHSLKFTAQSVPLGQLQITGQFIHRLVLTGSPYLVILDQPAPVVKIPTGKYSTCDVRLEKNGAAVFSTADPLRGFGGISVDDKTRAVLNRGGPVTNSVVAHRQGRDLALDYRLLGVGGETYQLANQDRSKPPAFAINKDGKKIASGTFEFG